MVDELTANDGRCSVFIFENGKEITDFMVDKWKALSGDAFRDRGLFVAALSGGSTPRDFYRDLAELGDHGIWERTHIFMVDERYVPFTDADSNYGMLSELLLSKVALPPANRHPVPVEEKTPEMAARKYEEEIRRFFELREDMFPQFDLVILGMGEDGHTASLFPGQETLREKVRLVYPVRNAPKEHPRVTLTLPVINHAGNIIFLVTGKEKAAAVRGVVEERNPSRPASMVRPAKGDLSFVLDREAASLLSPEFQRQCSTVTQ